MFTLNSLTGEYWQGPPPMDAGYLLDQNARNLAYESKRYHRGAVVVRDNVNTSTATETAAVVNSASVPATQLETQSGSLLPWLIGGLLLWLVLK